LFLKKKSNETIKKGVEVNTEKQRKMSRLTKHGKK